MSSFHTSGYFWIKAAIRSLHCWLSGWQPCQNMDNQNGSRVYPPCVCTRCSPTLITSTPFSLSQSSAAEKVSFSPMTMRLMPNKRAAPVHCNQKPFNVSLRKRMRLCSPSYRATEWCIWCIPHRRRRAIVQYFAGSSSRRARLDSLAGHVDFFLFQGPCL